MNGTEWFRDDMAKSLGRDITEPYLKVAQAVADALQSQAPDAYDSDSEFVEGFWSAIQMIRDYATPGRVT